MPRGSGSNRRVKRSMKPSLHGSVAISASPKFTHGIRGPSHEYAGGNNHERAEGTVDQDRALHRSEHARSSGRCRQSRDGYIFTPTALYLESEQQKSEVL